MSGISKYLGTKPLLTRVVVCYLIDGSKVILGLRKKASWGLGENLIAGIGGKVGDTPGLEDETGDAALIREVKEEIDVTITDYRRMGEIIFLFPHKPKWDQQVTAYVVTTWTGNLTETESIKPLAFDKRYLPTDRMWDDNQYWVPLVIEGKEINATFLYGEDNKTVAEKTIKVI